MQAGAILANKFWRKDARMLALLRDASMAPKIRSPGRCHPPKLINWGRQTSVMLDDYSSASISLNRRGRRGHGDWGRFSWFRRTMRIRIWRSRQTTLAQRGRREPCPTECLPYGCCDLFRHWCHFRKHTKPIQGSAQTNSMKAPANTNSRVLRSRYESGREGRGIPS